VTVCGGGRQSKSSGIWIDLRWKKTSRASWAERLFGPNTIIGCQNGMGWEREILRLKENCREEFGLLQFK
jgi:hypothetical protein